MPWVIWNVWIFEVHVFTTQIAGFYFFLAAGSYRPESLGLNMDQHSSSGASHINKLLMVKLWIQTGNGNKVSQKEQVHVC